VHGCGEGVFGQPQRRRQGEVQLGCHEVSSGPFTGWTCAAGQRSR
jgi:hypothetical protein